jgi:hypothetical protein
VIEASRSGMAISASQAWQQVATIASWSGRRWIPERGATG